MSSRKRDRDRTKGRYGGPKYHRHLSKTENRALLTLARQGLIDPFREQVTRLQLERLRPQIDAICRREETYRGRLVVLEVKIDNHTVCFNCLQPFAEGQLVDKHHPLPWRFHNLEGYPQWVPVVEVHRQCTCRWHGHHDPHDWQFTLQPFQICLAESQRLRYGFAIFDRAGLRYHPRLQVSEALLPFIDGLADQTTPTDKWRSKAGRLITLKSHFHDRDGSGRGHQERSSAALPFISLHLTP